MVGLTTAFFALAVGQWRLDRTAARVDAAATLARAVAWRAASALEVPEAEPTGLQALLHRLVVDRLGVETALVVAGARFFAHSDPALAGTRLSRDSLADKELYDRAARLRATVGKNIDERARNPELTYDAYAELDAQWRDGRRLLSVAVPVRQGGQAGRYLAAAEVEMRPRDLTLHLPWRTLLVAFTAVGLFALGGLRLAGRWRWLLGSALLAAAVALQAAVMVAWRAELRGRVMAGQAETLAGLAAAGVTDRDDAGQRLDLLAAARRTTFGAPIGDVLDVQDRQVGPAAWPDQVVVPAGEHQVVFATAHLAEQRRLDRVHLAQWGTAFALVALLFFLAGVAGLLARAGRALVQHRMAYGYLSPAMLGMLVLVFIPVVFGIVVGFAQRRYNVFEFAGLDNYIAILSDFDVTHPANFYVKLGVTVMWTVLNVSLHVIIGLFLALLLNDRMLKARGAYRVLLIVPWAIPNYITALIWKGMFHRQFGAVNYFVQALGFEPVAWFQTFWPAFATNLITNVWLGFPFMMVISLGALQSIPADLYDAAWVDGAGRWQRFRQVTLPLLMPALVPAVIVGTVWTFNMFNIIYLVSGGAPNGQTDILITDAYRWAFERDRYGYAAAYSTVIFIILLLFTMATNRITGATRSAFE
jgi:arabinogalactan oligomer/maltooligosaccharide transport system permease protein